ncbi:MAG TPA: hypothetical protein VEY95_13050 [Azospirillaceae bacterium]|nr:hypothetical protein [Azospirillaceae bacterium]
MNRLFSAKVLGATLVGLFSLACLPARAATELTIAFEDKEQFPNYLGNSAEIDPAKPGVHVELVKVTAAELGIALKLVRMPWKRALDTLKSGEVDGVFSGSFSADRLEIGVYPMKDDAPDESLRIGTIAYSLYRQKGGNVSWDGKTVSNLNGPVGAPAGYSIVADLRKIGVTVEESSATPLDLAKLKAGRVGAVAAQEFTADQLLKRADFAGIEKVTPALVVKHYYLLFSHQIARKDPGLIRKFWETLAKHRDVSAEALAAKYSE